MKALHTVRCETAWDGDQFGNEWTCGAVVQQSTDVDGDCFAVYEDDGAGNGNLLERFASFSDACEYADTYCQNLDAGAHVVVSGEVVS